MKKKSVYIHLIFSVLIILSLFLHLRAGLFITSFLVLANFLAALYLSRESAETKTNPVLDLKSKLEDLLNDVGKENVNPQQLTDMYLKSIKLFQTLITDKETGTINEKHFKSLFQNEVNRTVRYNKTFSLLMVKVLNARELREDKNSLLRRVAVVAKSFLRDVDIIGKYRDEYVAMLLPETGIKGAHTVGERLISYCRKIQDANDQEMNFILSIGISVCPLNGKNVDVLLNEAEKNIANADRLGGNQVIFNVE